MQYSVKCALLTFYTIVINYEYAANEYNKNLGFVVQPYKTWIGIVYSTKVLRLYAFLSDLKIESSESRGIETMGGALLSAVHNGTLSADNKIVNKFCIKKILDLANASHN